MMNPIKIIVLILGIASVRIGSINVPAQSRNQQDFNESYSNNSNLAMSTDDTMKKLRIDMVKQQIRSQLKMEVPPRSSEKPSETANETVDILLQETELQDQLTGLPIDRGERLVIYARNNGVKCLQQPTSFCRIFYFDMRADLNSSSANLWVFRTDESPSEVLSISVSHVSKKDQKFHKKYFRKIQKMGWNKLDLPIIHLPQSWNQNYQCLIELFGPAVEDHGERRPFIMVNKVQHVDSRQKREVGCDSNENCCLRPLSVSLVEIGFPFVLYPVVLEVNMCTGKCRMDYSEMKTHYERAMIKVLEYDSSLHDRLGACWTLCCKPHQIDPVRVIYNDSDGIIHDQYITDLTVKSCSCS